MPNISSLVSPISKQWLKLKALLHLINLNSFEEKKMKLNWRKRKSGYHWVRHWVISGSWIFHHQITNWWMTNDIKINNYSYHVKEIWTKYDEWKIEIENSIVLSSFFSFSLILLSLIYLSTSNFLIHSKIQRMIIKAANPQNASNIYQLKI